MINYKALALISALTMTFSALADTSTGSFISATDPVKYSDGRPSPKYKLYAKDEGVVFEHGKSPFGYDALGARDVAVYRHDGIYYMTYDGAGPTGWLTNMATSKDLRHWEYIGPMLELGDKGKIDSASASFGTLIYAEGYWHMYYLATKNASAAPNFVPEPEYLPAKAISKYPTGPWVKQYDKAPFGTKPGTFYNLTAAPGPVYHDGNGGYYMFFSPSNEKLKRTIGIARAKSINDKWYVDDNPVLPIDEQIENASIYYQESDKTWFMFVNHVGVDSDRHEYTDAAWVYWTKDFNHWNPSNKAVVLDSSNVKWSPKIIGIPSVVKVGDKLAILYDGQAKEPTEITDWSKDHMKRDIGLAWLKLPIKVPSQNEISIKN